MFSLKNKVALITGGGSGIGRATCMLFARQGATICILDFDENGGNVVAGEIKAAGQQAWFFKCNVAKQAEVSEAAEAIKAQLGRIDILVNNAGIAHIGNADNTSEEDFDRVL